MLPVLPQSGEYLRKLLTGPQYLCRLLPINCAIESYSLPLYLSAA